MDQPKSPSKESCQWGFIKNSTRDTPLQEGLSPPRQNVPVVFSGEPPGPSTVLGAQQGSHKYLLNE